MANSQQNRGNAGALPNFVAEAMLGGEGAAYHRSLARRTILLTRSYKTEKFCGNIFMDRDLKKLSPGQLRRAADILEKIQELRAELRKLGFLQETEVHVLPNPELGRRGRKQLPLKTRRHIKVTATTPPAGQPAPPDLVASPAGSEKPVAQPEATEPASIAIFTGSAKALPKRKEPLTLEQVFERVSQAIRENPFKIPTLRRYGVFESRNIVRQMKAHVTPASELPDDLKRENVYILGKNVAEDPTIVEGVKKFGPRVFGDLLEKISDWEVLFQDRGTLLLACRLRDILKERGIPFGQPDQQSAA